MIKLKSSFIDGGGVDDRGFRQLYVMVCRDKVITARRQRKPANTVVLGCIAKEVVAHNQRVPRIDRVLETRAYIPITARQHEAQTDLSNSKRGRRCENGGPDQFVVVKLVAIDFKKERRLVLDKRTAQDGAVLSH